MALLNRKVQIGLKEEATEGTFVAPEVTDQGFNVFEASFSPDIAQFERRPFRSSIGSVATIAGIRQAALSFTTELVGSGAIATSPPFKTIMQMCGYQEIDVLKVTCDGITDGPVYTGQTFEVGGVSFKLAKSHRTGDTTVYVYSPSGTIAAGDYTLNGGSAAGTPTVSITTGTTAAGKGYIPTSEFNDSSLDNFAPSFSARFYNDGIAHDISGCRGNFTLKAAVGEPMMMDVELTGALTATGNQPMLSPTYPTEVPKTFMGSNIFKIDNYAAVINNLEISSGNDLQYRSDVNKAAGIISTKIVNRAVAGSIDPEMVLTGTYDFFNKVYDNNEGIFDLTIGSGTGTTFLISGRNAQMSGITGGERSGLTTNNIDLSFNENLGNDELSILMV